MRERVLSILQGRLPQKFRDTGITRMEEATEFLSDKFVEAFNERFLYPCSFIKSTIRW